MGRQAAFSITPGASPRCLAVARQLHRFEGKHIWLRTTNLLGVQRTWRGDWLENNKPADIERWNAVPTPPASSAAQK